MRRRCRRPHVLTRGHDREGPTCPVLAAPSVLTTLTTPLVGSTSATAPSATPVPHRGPARTGGSPDGTLSPPAETTRPHNPIAATTHLARLAGLARSCVHARLGPWFRFPVPFNDSPTTPTRSCVPVHLTLAFITPNSSSSRATVHTSFQRCRFRSTALHFRFAARGCKIPLNFPFLFCHHEGGRGPHPGTV